MLASGGLVDAKPYAKLFILRFQASNLSFPVNHPIVVLDQSQQCFIGFGVFGVFGGIAINVSVLLASARLPRRLGVCLSGHCADKCAEVMR